MNIQTITPEEITRLLKKAYDQRGHQLPECIRNTEKALQLSHKLNDESLIAKSLSQLSLFYMINTKHDYAIDMAKEAIERFTKLGDEIGIANAKYNLAGVYYKTNNYHLGMFYLIDCLRTYREYGDLHNESKALKSLGAIYELLGDESGAIKVYEQSINCAQRIGDKNLESNVYNPLSGIFLKMGDYEKAIELIDKSINIKKETNDVRGFAFSIYGRGKIYLKQKKYELAEKDFLEACKIHEKFQDSYGITISYNKLAILWKETKRIEKAKELLLKSVDYSEKANLSLLRTKSCHLLYKIYKEEGDHLKALHYLEEYINVQDESLNSQTLKIIENYDRILEMQSQEKEAKLEKTKEEMSAKQFQIEQEAAMKQDFLSAMSHEIRTPLNAVTSIISLLKDRSNKDDKKLLTSLQFSSKNLLRIINDILDFSKLDSNKMILEKHPVDLYVLLHNIKEAYYGLAMDKGISIDIKMSPDSRRCYLIDETRIFQIIGNLVSNAIKFTDQGGVSIQIDMVEEKEKEDILAFKVIDTGSGIPKKDQKRLFESFFMPTSITTRNDGGTGLGLAIVKKLIALHGSTIMLDSQLGIGSSFYFKLKLEHAEITVKKDEVITQSLKNKIAIVAEDNEINALVMKELLKRWDISFIRAKNGQEAVEIAQKTKADFILMDIHMPVMNGFDAAMIIKKTEGPNKNTPIFALTADVTAPNKKEYITHFDAFLWKPIQLDRLRTTLAAITTDI